jgi:1,4-alpha-glucan branching enzyme
MKRHHHQPPTPTVLPVSFHGKDSHTGEPASIELKYNAPEARKVYVAGDFNNWRAGELRLSRAKTGPWKIELFLAPGRYEYRFIVDGEWHDDPSASDQVPNEFGSNNSVLQIHAGPSDRPVATAVS